jgi:hypothetical protein
MSAISDIRHSHLLLQYQNKICQTKSSHSDIGRVPIDISFVPIHQLPFRYRTKSISDIPISKIDKSFPNDPTKILVLIVLSHWFRTSNLYDKNLVSYTCATRIYNHRCRISNIGQKFIPISDVMSDSAHFSPISDIPISGSVSGLSAHLQ